MAKSESKPANAGINGKPWYWWVTHYECGPMPVERRQGIWYLYRCYDAMNNLLYVGTTLKLRGRFYKHKRESLWHKDISRVEVVEFIDMKSARYAEIQTIITESPLHNVRSMKRFTDGWDTQTPEQWRDRPDPGDC